MIGAAAIIWVGCAHPTRLYMPIECPGPSSELTGDQTSPVVGRTMADQAAELKAGVQLSGYWDGPGGELGTLRLSFSPAAPPVDRITEPILEKYSFACPSVPWIQWRGRIRAVMAVGADQVRVTLEPEWLALTGPGPDGWSTFPQTHVRFADHDLRARAKGSLPGRRNGELQLELFGSWESPEAVLYHIDHAADPARLEWLRFHPSP